MAEYEIRFIKKEDITAVYLEVADFYYSIGFSDEYGNVKKMIKNSQAIALASIGSEIIGAGRLIGDGIRYDTIADLNVRKAYRGLGIGTKLVRLLAENSEANFVNLTTDPNNPSLSEFYTKAGFRRAANEFVFDWPKS